MRKLFNWVDPLEDAFSGSSGEAWKFIFQQLREKDTEGGKDKNAEANLVNEEETCDDSESAKGQEVIANVAMKETQNNADEEKHKIKTLLASAMKTTHNDWTVRDAIADALNAIDS